MRPEPTASNRPTDQAAAIVAAVVQRIGDASSGDLLRFLTDRAIAEPAGTSAAAVRRTFSRGGGSEKMNRARMLSEALRYVVDRYDETCRENSAGYIELANALRAGAGIDAVFSAMAADVDDFVPASDPEVNAPRSTARPLTPSGRSLKASSVAANARQHWTEQLSLESPEPGTRPT